jgi:methylmalonyl-CoA/ethylmalonyl-CoA epimerase
MSRKIIHLGIIVHDLDAAVRQWKENFGFTEVHRLDISSEGLRTALLTPNGEHGETGVELIEPLDKADMKNPIARRLAQAGEGFYHIAMTEDELGARVGTLNSRGKKLIERPPSELSPAWETVIHSGAARQIVHPKDANGILVELLQAARCSRGG